MSTRAHAVDLMLNQLTFLDNLGRKQRSKKNAKLEDFLTDCSASPLFTSRTPPVGLVALPHHHGDPSAENDAPAPRSEGEYRRQEG